MSDQDATSAPMPLPPPPLSGVGLILEAAPRYVIGFPIFVSLTYDNRSGPVRGGLPDLVPWAVPDARIGFRLVSQGGGAAITHEPGRPERSGTGIALAAGELRRGIVDLTNHPADLRPGLYRLSLRVLEHSTEIESPAVTVELVAPSPAEAQESARLRALASDHRGTDLGMWWPFLARYWGTPAPSPALGAEAAGQLALLFFWHRAIFGPEAPAQLDVARLGAITAPHLQAEATALRLELLTARGDPGAPALRANLLSRYPGMGHRADAIDAGHGFITEARQLFGAESPFAGKLPKPPYTP